MYFMWERVVVLYRWLSGWLVAVLLVVGMPLSAAAAPGISSLSAVVYQPDSGLILYEKDARTPRPMASTTKLMTALLAAQLLDVDVTVRVPAAALPVEGSQVGLAAGDEVTVRDLLAGLLLASGNDAANALALLMADSLPAFATLMNQQAAALGMTDSHFVTPSGLDGDGHAASARDMALLGAAVLQYPLLRELCAAKTAHITLNGRQLTLKNHNKLLSLYSDCIGMKTGFTKKSGRCLVSAAEKEGVTLIAVTLNGGDYWNDHIALYNAAFPLVERQTLSAVPSLAIPVAGGAVQQTELVADPPPAFIVKADEKVTVRTEAPAMLWAPLEAGETVGQVRYLVGERELAVLPLQVSQTVACRPVPAGYILWWRRVKQLWNGLLN